MTVQTPGRYDLVLNLWLLGYETREIGAGTPPQTRASPVAKPKGWPRWVRGLLDYLDARIQVSAIAQPLRQHLHATRYSPIPAFPRSYRALARRAEQRGDGGLRQV